VEVLPPAKVEVMGGRSLAGEQLLRGKGQPWTTRLGVIQPFFFEAILGLIQRKISAPAIWIRRPATAI